MSGKHISLRTTPESLNALDELVFHPQFLGASITDVVNGSLVFTHTSLSGGNAIITQSVRPVDAHSIEYALVSFAQDQLLFLKAKGSPDMSNNDAIGLLRALEKNAKERLPSTMAILGQLTKWLGAQPNLNPSILRKSATCLADWRNRILKKIETNQATEPVKTELILKCGEADRMQLFLSKLGIVDEPKCAPDLSPSAIPTVLREAILHANLVKLLPAIRSYLKAIQTLIDTSSHGANAKINALSEFVHKTTEVADYIDLLARAGRLMQHLPHLVGNQGPSCLRESRRQRHEWFIHQNAQNQAIHRKAFNDFHIQSAHVLHFFCLLGLGEPGDFLTKEPTF